MGCFGCQDGTLAGNVFCGAHTDNLLQSSITVSQNMKHFCCIVSFCLSIVTLAGYSFKYLICVKLLVR